jgi:RNase P/RNase MRP subunit POP5
MKLRKMPSMREKKRYIVFRLHSKESVVYQDAKNAILNSINNWLGDNDMARANIWIIKNLWNQKEQSGFIRCSHRLVDEIKVALGLVHQIGDQRVIIQTTRVAATIKSGKEK